MTKYILSIGFAFFSLIASAHQPDISTTMLAEQEDGSWILQIKASLTAFEYEVHTTYGKDSYKTPEEFNALVIRHLLANISIDFGDAGQAKLTDGFVKLGHETNAIFHVTGIPKTIHKTTIVNRSFKDIHDNQSALIILKKDFQKKQFNLDASNDHTARLITQNNAFELQAKK